MSKSKPGYYFEDFFVGMPLDHATPRTVTAGDVAMYHGLYGSRFVVHSSEKFATAIGHVDMPLDDLLVFHIIFGKSVPDISLNAIANLGYAEVKFLRPVYPGDTLSADSEVIGVRESTDGKRGIVYVQTYGYNQDNDVVVSFIRWVMVRKGNEIASAPKPVVPECAAVVEADELGPTMVSLKGSQWDCPSSGSTDKWSNYKVGERIDHVDGMTIEEADHMTATRLYQNTAKVHHNAHQQSRTKQGRRLVYGGVIMSIARALSFNGLANAFHITAINSGTHANPAFAGDTVYAWSEILAVENVKCHSVDENSIGALRVRTVATKDVPCAAFPDKDADGKYPDGVILDLDYWVLIPK